MYPPKIGYVIPENIDETFDFLEDHEDARPLAGGHSLIPALKLRIIRPSYLVEIRRFKELNYVKFEGGKYRIGALTTHYDISKAGVPLLSQAATKIADPQVRNMGTIGGSISHLDPAADYPASLIAADAEVKIKSKKGERTVSFKDFAKDMFTPDLNPGELVVEVQLPDLRNYKYSYEKLERRAGDFAIVGVAVLLKLSGDVVDDVRIGLTAVNNVAVRAKEAEEELIGKRLSQELIEKASSRAVERANPSSDIRGSAEYKKKMVKVMTKRAIINAIGGKI
ncbi:glyceraldehyde dehydrogenase subunit beta [Sulfolobus acidocaldarius]|uniref:Carbon monoxide dehydrogenase medium chain n=4 Tax=Sulfolobus acidocaldarius TaxID=2285 RepID=Q4JAA1_SULAC|nr:glyceraldehyde dehydrogenase subunit beta [Sulfolobus acidocaldarius]AAY80279.1 carbon monoxide dehydrogenase medium chain [Sulfolobus acidocaldarius DSM 639]AGE70859.1 carbon monoxide dehydrogenase medium chain [Sulfolobus acidocaldarius N8]AGE73130.1 carbon monoxide dehydrogenase medium chain [Sulfolobus acidocaldarius Ron12/I]ALU28831.1 carbon monoxide dehydrogenase [Sulfolobus acidocaldarius]ALU31550.1 carbon monoxide dehydrogenase [Sulfolobus acidocaldarius]